MIEPATIPTWTPTRSNERENLTDRPTDRPLTFTKRVWKLTDINQIASGQTRGNDSCKVNEVGESTPPGPFSIDRRSQFVARPVPSRPSGSTLIISLDCSWTAQRLQSSNLGPALMLFRASFPIRDSSNAGLLLNKYLSFSP